MKKYQRILVALDLDNEHDKLLLARSKEINEISNAEVYYFHSIHVEKFLSKEPACATKAQEEKKELEVQQKKMALIKELVASHVDDDHIQIVRGEAKNAIVKQAKKLNIDLIIIGSHTKHGLSLLLGSPADAVLHHAICDVLAIHCDH